MTNFNANLVSLSLHKRLWKHPFENDFYWFTNGNFNFFLDVSEEYMLANIIRKDTLQHILYKIYDKVVESKTVPFITIDSVNYEIVFLAVGTSDDKLVLKTSENEELVFVSYPFGK